ncbi:MAG: TIGR01777 family oxidoreductase [Balneolales bacterium]
MKIVLTGATGFIGTHLTNMLEQRGHDLVILTRTPDKYKGMINRKRSYRSVDHDVDSSVEGCNAIINLAGENLIARRWTRKVKEELIHSRVWITSKLVEAIEKANKKPEVMISASAAGYYGSRGDEVLTEDKAPGNKFDSEICIHWEEESRKAEKDGVRVVNPRFGIPLETDGGALAKMLTPFWFFVGGPIGSGKQYFPWIHMRDLGNSIMFALEHTQIKGPYNASSPNPVTMEEFAKTLGKVMNRPSVLKVPEFALILVFGEGGRAMITSSRLEPKAIYEAGFKFEYPLLEDALQALLKK